MSTIFRPNRLMYIDRTENKLYAFLIFLIWPFLSVIIAFKEYRYSWAKNIIWFFTAYFAYSKVDPPEYYTDAVGYRSSFISFAKEGTFSDLLDSFIFGETADFFEPILKYVISRFTDNYQIYFMIIGLMYGYFYSRNLWMLLDKVKTKLTFVSVFIFIIFSLIIPIWNLGGFRFYLASQVFIYGIFNFLILKNKSSIFFLLFSPIIHFSFVLPVISFLIYKFIGNRTTIFFLFFLFSSLFAEIAQNNLKQSSEFLPKVYSERVEGYTNEEYIESISERKLEANWYLSFANNVIGYSSYLFILLLYWKRKLFLYDKDLVSIFSFTLLFYGIINMISGTAGIVRFYDIIYLLSFSVMFLFIQYYDESKIKKYIYLTFPFLAIFIIVSIRKGFDNFGLSTIFGNPFIAMFLEEKYPLIDFIKALIM